MTAGDEELHPRRDWSPSMMTKKTRPRMTTGTPAIVA
jgi:hypothetical protein